MRFMSDFREAMWGVVQAAVSELDFDFAAYAIEHFDRLERTADEPAFRAALGTETTRGAWRRPSQPERERLRRLRWKLELPSLFLLHPLELLLGAHADGALEPVFADSDHQPPKMRPIAREPEDRVVRELPVEVVLPGRPTL